MVKADLLLVHLVVSQSNFEALVGGNEFSCNSSNLGLIRFSSCVVLLMFDFPSFSLLVVLYSACCFDFCSFPRRTVMQNLKMNCPFKYRGCTWQGCLSSFLKEHHEKCEYAEVMCSLCHQTMPRSHALEHKENECPNRLSSSSSSAASSSGAPSSQCSVNLGLSSSSSAIAAGEFARPALPPRPHPQPEPSSAPTFCACSCDTVSCCECSSLSVSLSLWLALVGAMPNSFHCLFILCVVWRWCHCSGSQSRLSCLRTPAPSLAHTQLTLHAITHSHDARLICVLILFLFLLSLPVCLSASFFPVPLFLADCVCVDFRYFYPSRQPRQRYRLFLHMQSHSSGCRAHYPLVL